MLTEGRALPVDGGHELRLYDGGPMDATPVLLLHGGPGGGAVPAHRDHYDAHCVRLVQIDQRGTGRSIPPGSLHKNTTDDLVSDIEAVRRYLGLDSWWVAGGSWGALLALAYTRLHPKRVRGLLLRSVFLDRRQDLDHLLHDAQRYAPCAHTQLQNVLGNPVDLLNGLSEVVLRGSGAHMAEVAGAWRHYERVLACLAKDGDPPPAPTPVQVRDTVVELHYLTRRFFLGEDDVTTALAGLHGIPGFLVHGELDRITPPEAAQHLARTWPDCTLRIVPGAGHALNEPRMEAAWVETVSTALSRDRTAASPTVTVRQGGSS